MNQITKANNMDTAHLLRYVQDMSEIEQSEYLLRKAADKLNKEANSMMNKINTQIERTQKSISFTSTNLSSYEDELDSERQKIIDLSPVEFDKQAPVRPQEADEFYELKEKMRGNAKDGKINLEEETVANIWAWLFLSLVMIVLGGAVVVPIIGAILGVVVIVLSLVIPGGYSEGIVIAASLIGAAIIWSIFVIILVTKWYKRDKRLTKQHNEMFVRYKFLEPIVEDYEEKLRKYEASREVFARDEKAKEERLRKITAQQTKTTQWVEKYKAELVSLQDEYSHLIAQKSIDESKACLLKRQADILLEKADVIHGYKRSLYQIGIVPPDYRTFDCVTILAFIFRNNLAQTMTEAILQYEERVYRGEILRGIDNIYKMLGKLSYSMQAIEYRLVEIKQSVDNVYYEMVNVSNELYDMRSDIRTASDLAHRDSMQRQFIEDLRRQEQESDRYSQIDFQNKLLAETKATRYAMDAMSQSMYKAEWYMEQRRQGLL